MGEVKEVKEVEEEEIPSGADGVGDSGDGNPSRLGANMGNGNRNSDYCQDIVL